MSNINPIKKDRLEHLLDHYYYGMVADRKNFKDFIAYMPKDLLPLYFRIEGYDRLGWTNVIGKDYVADDDEVTAINIVGETSSIQTGAFCNCPKLEKVTIKTARSINVAEGAFKDCPELKQVLILTKGRYNVDGHALINCPSAEIVVNVIKNDTSLMQNRSGNKQAVNGIYVDETIKEWAKNDIICCLENLDECVTRMQQIIPSLPIKRTEIHFTDNIDTPEMWNNTVRQIKSISQTAGGIHRDRYDDDGHYIRISDMSEYESKRADMLLDRLRDLEKMMDRSLMLMLPLMYTVTRGFN